MEFIHYDWKPYTLVTSCVRALGELRETDAVPYLESLLSTRFPSLKLAVIGALSQLTPHRYLNEFQDVLLDDVQPPQVRLACLEALFDSVHVYRMIPILTLCVNSNCSTVREEAICKVRYLQLNGTLKESPGLLRFVLKDLFTLTHCSHDRFSQLALEYLSNLGANDSAELLLAVDDAVYGMDLLEVLEERYPDGALRIAKRALAMNESLTASRFLARKGDRQAIMLLRKKLGVESLTVRIKILETLSSVSSGESVHELCAIASDPALEVESRCMAMSSLSEIGGKAAEECLIFLLRDETPRIRYGAAMDLGAFQTAQTGEALISSLGDPHSAVVENAIGSLGKIRYAPAAKVIIQRYQELVTKDHLVCGTICQTLGELGDTGAIPIVLQEIEKGNWITESDAPTAIAQLGGTSEIEALCKLVETAEGRDTAFQALLRMETPEATKAIANFLNHADARIRWWAAHSLGVRELETHHEGRKVTYRFVSGRPYADEDLEDWCVAKLIDALEIEKDDSVRNEIVETLASIDNSAASKPILKILVEIISTSDYFKQSSTLAI